MKDQLQQVLEEAKKRIGEAKNVSELQELKTLYVGKKSPVQEILKNLKNVSLEEKREIGPFANQIKMQIEQMLSETLMVLQQKELEVSGKMDPTLPGKGPGLGSLHPISLIQYQVEDIFGAMGFRVLDGPQLESAFFCFETLNMPEHHPARDMQDTFYIKGMPELVMRTHTSAMQVRALKEYGVPLRAVFPGRCFRNEATDATHEHTFYQVEGLMVDKKLSISHLIGVMKHFLSAFFGKEVTVRARPGYFPFVEPAFELDIKCLICGGVGCKACKQRGWLEILPCGMVHPKVLEAAGIDPKQYEGFAFGLGLDRLVMMKYGVDDIRLFQSGDLSFIKQF